MLAQNRNRQYAKTTLAKSNVGLGSLSLNEAQPLLKRYFCACMLCLVVMVRYTGTRLRVLVSFRPVCQPCIPYHHCLAALMVGFLNFPKWSH